MPKLKFLKLKIGKFQGILEKKSILLSILKEFSELTQGIFGKTQGFFFKENSSFHRIELVTIAEKRQKSLITCWQYVEI